MKIGIGTYAFAWAIGVQGYPPNRPMSVMTFLKAASKLDAECVQITDNLPLHLYSMQEIRDIREEAEELSLDVEVGLRGLTVESVEEHLTIASMLNSSILRVVIDDNSNQPTINEIYETIGKLIPSLQSAGIKLAIENHDRLSSDEFLLIMEQVDSEVIGICLDSVNSLGRGEGFKEVASKLIPYTINVHIKDYKIARKNHQMGFEVSGTKAGAGMLPIDWLISELSTNSVCQSAILELWPPLASTLEKTIEIESQWAGESMQYLMNLAGQFRLGDN